MNETMFLRALREKPNDLVTRLVYADWLEERGDPDSTNQAAYLRAEAEWAGLPEDDEDRPDHAERLRALAEPLDVGWLAVVSRRPIENCAVRFEFRCPRQWDNLAPTRNDRVRFCASCRNKVYFCETLPLAWEHAAKGHCVAISAAVARTPDDLSWPALESPGDLVGILMPPEPTPPQEEAASGPPPAAPRRSWWARLFRRK